MRLYEMNYQKCTFCTCLKSCGLAKIRLAAKLRAAWPRSLQQGSFQQDSGFNRWTSLIVLQSWWLMLMFDYFNDKEHLTNHSRHFFSENQLYARLCLNWRTCKFTFVLKWLRHTQVETMIWTFVFTTPHVMILVIFFEHKTFLQMQDYA